MDRNDTTREWRFFGLPGRVLMTLFAALAATASIMAVSTIWLLLTDPVSVADGIGGGDITPLVRQLAGVLYEAVRHLIRFL